METWNATTPPQALAELTGVVISDPQTGELVGYDGTEWVNMRASALHTSGLAPVATIGTLQSLTDTTFGSILPGQLLVYDRMVCGLVTDNMYSLR